MKKSKKQLLVKPVIQWFVVENKPNPIIVETSKDPIIITRGWGNGYAVIPKEHPYYGRDYNDIPVFVHGGLTFGRLSNTLIYLCQGSIIPPEIPIPEDSYIVGFDTAHCDDDLITIPKEYVEQQAQSLAKQLEDLWH